MSTSGIQALWAVLTADGAGGSVQVERQFATTAEDLWSAVTDPARLARWFVPVSGDLRVGGRYRADMGQDGTFTGRVLACRPGCSYTVSWAEGGTEESEVDVAVQRDGDAAVLTLHHRRLPLHWLADYGAGWQDFLEQLASGAPTGPGRVGELLPGYRAAAAAVGVPAWAGDLDGVLRRVGGLPAVRFERRYATAAADLWSALTDPDRLARWFMPVSGDLQVGGSYTVDYGDGATGTGSIVRCEAPERLAVTWQIDGGDAGVVSARIIPGCGECLLRLEHVRLPDEQGVGYAAGWHTYLDRLAGEVTENGSPDDVDFGDRWSEVIVGYRELGRLALG